MINDNKMTKEEALAIAKTWNFLKDKNREALETLVPELQPQESEDEKIRKALIYLVKSKEEDGYMVINNASTGSILAWIEKQCKEESDPRYKILEELIYADDIYQMSINDKMIQEAREKAVNAMSKIGISELLGFEKQSERKPANKIKPKFYEGDWITNESHDICLITDIDLENGYYICKSNRFGNTDGDIDLTDKAFHLWTIEDAKEGDVLAGSYGTFILMGKSNGGYCGVLSGNTFIRSTGNNEWTEDLHPATKEQRDILFAKMREEGYEWDAEKKELRKIEEKPKWTEEDECYMGECISAVATKDGWSFEEKRKTKHWLESLKQRMEEQQ